MGTDKAFVEFEGTTLLARALMTGSAVGPVRIVGSPERFQEYGTVVADVFAGQGPLAGIHAALRSSDTEWNVVLAVDMPFVRAELLHMLVGRARECGKSVTVPRVAGRFQPLCAVYRREFADVAERALGEQRNKIDPLFAPAVTHIVEEGDIEMPGFSAAMFGNLNTVEDLERARLALQEWK
jgi:molybdenum cofactor guanylyltransferase